MKRTSYDVLSLAAILAAGVGLTLVATFSPPHFARVGGWLALLGYLLTILVVIGTLRPKLPGTSGLMAILAGLILLALAVVPQVFVGTSDFLEQLTSLPQLSLLFQATGAVGLALGFVVVSNGLADRAVRSDTADQTHQKTVTDLERKIKMQGERLQTLLTCDELTGAMTRAEFLHRLEEVALRDARLGKSFGFLLVDIVDFRGFNARHGRLEGDAALKYLAQALQGATRGTDSVGRLGGDEFAVVLGECSDPRPAVNRLFLTLADGPRYGEQEEPMRVRVGAVTVAEPEYGADFTKLFQLAQEAMESVSGAGGSMCAERTLQSARPRSA